jgi:hypothetical protein
MGAEIPVDPCTLLHARLWLQFDWRVGKSAERCQILSLQFPQAGRAEPLGFWHLSMRSSDEACLPAKGKVNHGIEMF